MTIWLAFAGAALPAPAQPPAALPDQAICELHVWPASGMTSIRQRASESNRMTGLLPELIQRAQRQAAERADAKADARLAQSAAPEPLSTARQTEVLHALPLSDLFGGSDYRTVIHGEPLESRAIRSVKSRYSAATMPCYAELVLVDVVYSREYARGRNLKTLFRYRQFNGSAEPYYSFGTWAQTKLEIFSFDPLRSDEAALNELASALRSNVVLFSEYLERGRQSTATNNGKSE